MTFLWYHLASVDFSQWQKMGSSLANHPTLIATAIVMMPINWLLESRKWRLLNFNFLSLRRTDSLKAVLAGTYLSLFTPNRIGDMAGRVFLTPPPARKKAATASFYGSVAQLTITVLLGSIASFWIYAEIEGVEPFTAVLLIATIITATIAYFNLEKISKRLFSILPARWNMEKHFHTSFEQSVAAKTLLLSFLRYAVFATQFVILLKAFGIELSLLQFYSGIAVIYLVSAVVPTALLGELGIRESVAIFVFGFWTNEPAGIFAATFALWIINLVVPAVVGGYFFNSSPHRLIRVRS
ncbi:lysylphosphatidylglycerol synthase domain-containing protein [Flavobacteriales bacterium DA487]